MVTVNRQHEGLIREIFAVWAAAGDFGIESASRPGKLYRMTLTPEGYAVHQDEGCEQEAFGGPLGCRHSRLNSERIGDVVAFFPETDEEKRFWSKVAFSPTCWEWQASTNQKGYGQVGINGKTELSHRVAFRFGFHEPTALVCHHCDNPSCCRPSHLFEGTSQENTTDRDRKGRTQKGESHVRAKLTVKQVMEIRESPETNRILANRFGVHHSVIGKIKTNQIWRTTMNNQVLTVQSDAILTPRPIEFSAEQVELIKTTIAKGSSDDELDLFIATCRRTGLDPFLRQIYAVKRYDASENKSVMAIQVGIDGQRLIAERTGLYDGQDPVEFLDENGQWSEVWTGAGDHPIAARCAVYRKDWSAGRKATATVRFQSYAQTYKKNNQTFLMPTWAKMPDVMLGKCAESLALRRAFPAEMSAIAALAGSTYDPAAEADEEIAPEHVEEPDAVEGAFTVVDEGDNEKPDTTDADPPATDTACPEGGEHLPQYSEDLTVMACSKCGTALEGPEENA